jgi:hypothetical protein
LCVATLHHSGLAPPKEFHVEREAETVYESRVPERRSQGANPHRATAFLDGVRGWASLAVLIHHAREGFFRRSDSPAQHWLLVVLGDGSMAVHVFFVLSGFVLSVRYLESGNLGDWAAWRCEGTQD